MSILYLDVSVSYQCSIAARATLCRRYLHSVKRFVPIAAALVVVACGEGASRNGAGETGGTLVIASTQDPETLFPPLVLAASGRQITEQLYDYLADVGPDLNIRDETRFRPALADRWRWLNDSMMLAFHINPAARWHDGRDVTARDVAFTFALNRNPAVNSRILTDIENIDSVTVTDSLTAVFWFHKRSPTQFLDAAAQMLILPAHQLENLRPDVLRQNPPPPIGTGRFRLRKWDKGTSVELVADTSNFRGRAKLDRVIWSIVPEFQTALARLLGGEADLLDALRPENLRPVAAARNLRTITLPGMDYGFLRFNLRDPSDRKRPHPLFADRELRRALTRSLDRVAMARNILDTFALVPVGPNVRAFASTDPSRAQLPYDSARASRTLDSLGWIRGSDGIRAKNGKELAFNLIVPSESMNRMKMAPLIQEQLRRAGARVQLETLQLSTEVDRERRGAFDASLGGWVMPSSPDAIRAAWTTAGIGENGTNFGGYSNPRFDALLDSALWAPPEAVRQAFTRAYTVINEDAPAVWLYEPRKIIGLHRRLRTAAMRPDAWWFDLADWYIPRVDRIPRDLIPMAH
jgi:peptide/nickel transport system substrate-binding protein